MKTLLHTRFDLGAAASRILLAYLTICAAVLLLLMLFGLFMRSAQADLMTLNPGLFYQIMTAHGAGMIGIAGLGGLAIMWYFLSRYVVLSRSILLTNLLLFLLGVVMILGAIFIGGFAAGWTFLYPLPALSGGVWGTASAIFFLGGLLIIGVGFLLLYLDIGRAIIKKYGNIGRALGWPQIMGRELDTPPPAAVVASTMVMIINTLGIVAGAVVLVMSLVNLITPAFLIDALLTKTLIYFFGHVFINASIYMAVIAVYEILPEYANRPWKVNRVFLLAWNASTLMVIGVFPHHMLMDFVMPTWVQITAQVVSYTNGIPVLVVTAYGALTLVYRSGLRWDMASGLLFLSMFGWAGGVVPAIVDATIRVNTVMHNTMWVPGHFHFYLLLGLLPMFFGFMYYLAKKHDVGRDTIFDGICYWMYASGGLGFALLFLYSGKESVPRRWAQHLPEWFGYNQLASGFALLIILAVLIFALRFISRVPRLGSELGTAS